VKKMRPTYAGGSYNPGDKNLPAPSANETLDYAIFYLTYGLSVIPLRHGEKTPLIKWERYQKEAPSMSEVRKWFEDNGNIGIVCGRVSGDLVVVDFDDVEVYNKFMKQVEGDSELKDIIENTWMVQTGKGYHIYLRVDSDNVVKTGKLGSVDIKGEGGYVVAPPSVHPSGKRYTFLRFTKTTGHQIRVISEELYNRLLELLEKATETKLTFWWAQADEKPKVEEEKHEEAPKQETQIETKDEGASKGRALTNTQILEIVKILEPVYKAGARHGIILFLTGWLYKSGVAYESAEALVKAICDNFGDEEREDRLYTLRDTYGATNTPREERIKAQGKELKTKGGLFDWAVNQAKVTNEETALAIVKDLEEILGTAEPAPSVVIERLNYDKEYYAVVNFKRFEVLTAMWKAEDDRRLIYKDRVFLGCPESVTAVVTPFSQIIKYDIVWNIPLQRRKLALENVTVDEILAYLKANGLVLKKYQAEDVLNAILNAMLRKGLAGIKTGFDAPGFYWMDGKIMANKVEVSEPDPKELKEALELLNELVGVWFSNVKEQFVTVLKLGLLVPFSFAIKQKFKGEKGFLPWLYLYGQRDTGKTTTAEILLYIYNIMNRQHELGVGEANTEARLGAVLSSDTFPHVINEGASLFEKPHLSEIIKQAIEGLIARQRFENKTIIKEYPAFAPLTITANELRITDEALTQKRLVVIRYPITAKVTKERIAEFREKVSHRLPKLRALGQFTTWYLVKHPDELTYDWINLSKKLLEKAYEGAGLAPGFDINMQFIDFSEDDPRLDIIAVLWKKILDAYNKKVEVTNDGGYYVAVSNPLGILESVLESRAVDFMIKKNDEVLFTSRVLQILRDEGGNIDSMAALAETFADYKFTYERKKVMGKTMRVLTVKNEDLTRLFYDFFNSGEEDKDTDGTGLISPN